jgi:hypothetical protein
MGGFVPSSVHNLKVIRERSAAAPDDDVAAEAEAMLRVANAIAALDDPESRDRVFRWLIDRYQLQPVSAPETESAASAAPAGRPVPKPNFVPDPEFAVDNLSEFFTDIEQAQEPDEPPPAAAAPKTGIDSMIRGFAADIRRLANDWRGE